MNSILMGLSAIKINKLLLIISNYFSRLLIIINILSYWSYWYRYIFVLNISDFIFCIIIFWILMIKKNYMKCFEICNQFIQYNIPQTVFQYLMWMRDVKYSNNQIIQ